MMSTYNISVLAICILLTALGCTQKPPLAPPAKPVVSVSVPLEKPVTDFEEFTGRVDSISVVEIRARVTGYLTKVAFKDGDFVKKDQLLYEIDLRPFQGSLDRAKGDVERYEGQKQLLDTQVNRYKNLVAKQAASQQELDTYIGQQAENIGALAAAKAQAYIAKLNLEFCTITSPIDGKMSRTFFTPGNLVAADTTLLTTVMQYDPMYVYFNVDEPTLLRVQKAVHAGAVSPEAVMKTDVIMGLADDVERRFPHRGTFNFVNNMVDPTTGTITVRGVFPNKDHALTPGLFARVRVPLSKPYPGLLVTDRAIGTDQGQKYVYIIDKDNKVQYRRVTLGPIVDGLRVIKEGIEPGVRVVVNGLQRVRPQMEVETEVVELHHATDKVTK